MTDLPPHDTWVVNDKLYDLLPGLYEIFMKALATGDGHLTILKEPLMPLDRIALMRKGTLVKVFKINLPTVEPVDEQC